MPMGVRKTIEIEAKVPRLIELVMKQIGQTD